MPEKHWRIRIYLFTVRSLASASRFTTIELGELARKITEAADKALAVEMQLFFGAGRRGSAKIERPSPAAAGAMAAIDVGSALADLAIEQNYARPLVDQSLSFEIKGGRHPVVEQALKSSPSGATFVANDCDLAPEARLWLLTGPQHGGQIDLSFDRTR